MKYRNGKKFNRLYGRKISVKFVVLTLVFYLLAAILWYIIAAVSPYMNTVEVGREAAAAGTREAMSATAAEIARDEKDKERAFLMPSGADSFYRRLRLVEDAQKSIDFMVYDSYEEEYTTIFYTALLRAADRGVKVRILVDGKMGVLNGSLSQIGTLLQNHNNIEFYYYNGVNIADPAGLFVMMHDKVMLVDGSIAIVGGVNMGTSAFLYNFDMEVMITNSGAEGCAGAVKRYYDDMTVSSLARHIVSQNANYEVKTQYIDDFERFFAASGYAETKIDYSALGVPVNKVTYLTNGAEGNKKQPIIYKALCNLGASSKKSTFVTPYTLLENDKKKDIIAIAAKNDDFRLVTNSLYNTRNVAFADYYYSRKSYLTGDITIFEYQAENQLHAKMYTFDDRFAVIGSFNLDERSCHIDTESVVVIDSEEFTAIVNEYIDETFVKNSLQVGADNEYMPSDTVSAHEVPQNKRILYGLYRALGIVRCLI